MIIGFALSKFLMQKAMLVVLSLILLTSTLFEKDLFGNMHYELFEEVADDIVEWNHTYGEDDIYTVYNLNNPNYMKLLCQSVGRRD